MYSLNEYDKVHAQESCFRIKKNLSQHNVQKCINREREEMRWQWYNWENNITELFLDIWGAILFYNILIIKLSASI